jgi:hypothetical protein
MHAQIAALAFLFACSPATEPPAAVPPKGVAVDAAQEKADGFVALFNGTDLAGWVGDTKGYKVESLDGQAAIVCQPGGTNLFTKDEFADFELRLEFKLTAGANNGLALRAPLEGDPAYTGFESQVLDNTDPKYKGLKDWQYHGSLYGVAAATATALKPVGEWNVQTVTMKGTRVTIVLNRQGGARRQDRERPQGRGPDAHEGPHRLLRPRRPRCLPQCAREADVVPRELQRPLLAAAAFDAIQACASKLRALKTRPRTRGRSGS